MLSQGELTRKNHRGDFSGLRVSDEGVAEFYAIEADIRSATPTTASRRAPSSHRDNSTLPDMRNSPGIYRDNTGILWDTAAPRGVSRRIEVPDEGIDDEAVVRLGDVGELPADLQHGRVDHFGDQALPTWEDAPAHDGPLPGKRCDRRAWIVTLQTSRLRESPSKIVWSTRPTWTTS